MTFHNVAFPNLYPDVDPSTPIPVTVGERLAACVAAGTLAFGAASGDLIITGVGLVLVLFATVVPASKTARRIRREARARFPQEEWIEEEITQSSRTSLFVPLIWVIIAVVSLVMLRFVDAAWGPIVAAIIAVVLTWFTPGMFARKVKEEELE
ncbi:cell-surface hemin receptor [Corynebacterium suranareeae]|uniref:Cell-surface hemin receptor n=1 Tax=Corynebacterium suranareeae TaxID=2506452 RepID=A0A161JLX3_9CORY|nr:hypothetical protein [Corynebacterium suranareeae]BAU94788.1 cell-surface hemin receptor [Corynebacterium suranareeae]